MPEELARKPYDPKTGRSYSLRGSMHQEIAKVGDRENLSASAALEKLVDEAFDARALIEARGF